MTDDGSAFTVDVADSGRGGSITYREGDHTIHFDWELADSPALALIWGPSRAEWAAGCSWAADRQAEIFGLVGAEVVRQRAQGCTFDYDIESGEMTIYERHARHGKP